MKGDVKGQSFAMTGVGGLVSTSSPTPLLLAVRAVRAALLRKGFIVFRYNWVRSSEAVQAVDWRFRQPTMVLSETLCL
jgi:hypothetical protein